MLNILGCNVHWEGVLLAEWVRDPQPGSEGFGEELGARCWGLGCLEVSVLLHFSQQLVLEAS